MKNRFVTIYLNKFLLEIVLRTSLILLIFSFSFFMNSKEACGAAFERDCGEKDIYLLIDEAYEADRDGDLLLFQELDKKVKTRCKEAITKHLKLFCRSYAFQDQARSAETEEDVKKFIEDMKNFISDFQKLDYFHTDFIYFFNILLPYEVYDENLYQYIKESIFLSKPKSENANPEEYLHALAVWYDNYKDIIQNHEEDEDLIIKTYEKLLDIYAKLDGKKSYDYLRTKLNLAYYYEAYYYLDLSYLTKSYEICAETILSTDFENFIDAHLSCWHHLDSLERLKDSGSTQKGYYYRVYLENYFKALSEYDFFDIYMDKYFLDSFPGHFSLLSCYERQTAWNIYQDLWEIRWAKYTGEGSLDNKREDYESLGADISISADALRCSEDGMDESLVEDLISGLYTSINKSFNVDIEESDIGELFTISDAIEVLSFHISNDKYQELLLKHYQRVIKEAEYAEEHSQASANLIYGLEMYLGYEKANKQEILRHIQRIKEQFVEAVTDIGLDSDDAVVFDVLTKGLYGNGFKDEAFKNYLEMFSLSPLMINSDLDPFLGDAFHADTRLTMNSLILKDKFLKLAYQDLFANLKYLDRGPLELSIIKSKLSDGLGKQALENFLKSERLKNRFINEYSEGKVSINSSERSQENIFNSIRQFSNLSTSQKSEIYLLLYPEITLEKIKSKIKEDETLILLYRFSTGPVFSNSTKNFITSIAINKSGEKLEIKEVTKIGNLDFYEFVESIEEEMKQSLFDGSKDYIKKIDVLSKVVIPDIELKDKIIFVSNLDEFISPSLLRKEDKWLIEDKEIIVNFSLVDFLTEEQLRYNIPSNYIGIGNVDYSGFDEIYDALPNTSLEIKNTSLEFQNKKIFLGKNANETSIKELNLSYALVHFATHTSKSGDSYNQLPSIVLTKNEFNDGYLDVFEISELNFNDSHIVLAACDTDSSIYEDADKFSGFIKSFQIAGAKSVLATRWEIETNSAQTLIESYIRKLIENGRPQYALLDTQREFIRNNYHPFLWSGYFVIE